jgi:hypothetical protein
MGTTGMPQHALLYYHYYYATETHGHDVCRLFTSLHSDIRLFTIHCLCALCPVALHLPGGPSTVAYPSRTNPDLANEPQRQALT